MKIDPETEISKIIDDHFTKSWNFAYNVSTEFENVSKKVKH